MLTALLWYDKMHKNKGEKLLHLTIEFFANRCEFIFFFTFPTKYATIQMYNYKNKEKERSLCLLL